MAEEPGNIHVVDTIPSDEEEKLEGIKNPNEAPQTSNPTPALLKPQPAESNLPPVDSTIAREAAALGLYLVEATRDGPNLFVMIEGDHPEDVMGTDSRKLAYDARHHYGFDNAGIAPHGGMQRTAPNDDSDARYRQVWRLTRGL